MDLKAEKILVDAITKAQKSKVAPYTTTAVVTSVMGETIYVKIPGSENSTPIKNTSVSVKVGDVVDLSVSHNDTHITGNRSDIAMNSTTTNVISQQYATDVKNFVAAEYAKIDELSATNATIENLKANKADIESLTAINADISDLKANTASIADLNATNATVKELSASKANITDLNATNATIEKLKVDKADVSILEATNAEITKLKSDKASIADLNATNAAVSDLKANKANVKDLEANTASINYLKANKAEIDLSNIGTAAIEKIFSDTGLIKNLVVGDQTITGNLVGVTISGDLIEGNTIKADKLVVLGSDGLYYKLNVNGETVESEQTDYNSLNGSNIQAKSITATKIAVDDLVAFGATIGGFHITNNSIYSGVKESIHNETRGIYLDNDGQIAFGNSSDFIKFYKDSDGKYKLELSAKSMIFSSSGKSVEDEIGNIKNEITSIPDMKAEMETIKDEVTTLLRIESSRGTVFKNDNISTVLSVVIYRGSKRITDISTLHDVMGNGCYLQWKWQRLNEDSFGIISSSDSRIGNDGFTFTLSPEDVDTKVTFMCELIDS